MASPLASLAAGLSIVTLGFAAYQLGAAVRKLQEELEAKEAAKLKPATTGGRAMFSGLYPAVEGPGKDEAVPGFRFIVAAGGLGLVSLLLGLIPSTPAVPAIPQEVLALEARVDSLALTLAQQRTADSIAASRVAMPQAPAPRRAERSAVATRLTPSAAIPAAILPDTAPIRIP